MPLFHCQKDSIYSKGQVTDNQLTRSGNIQSWSVPPPDKYIKEKNVSVMEEYFSRIYTVVPGLEIIS
jgi:hypothetical protein